MLRNWYAVYTKPQKEKFVSSAFARKGFECFCPVVNINSGKSNNKKTTFEPLFMCFVFVYMSEGDISSIKSIPGVLNILYWKSKPALIKAEEIAVIKHFTVNFINIKLIKSSVNLVHNIAVKDEPVILFKENAVSVKYQTVKAYLPSLGYTLIAERGIKEEEPVYQESGLLKTFPRLLNSLFFN